MSIRNRTGFRFCWIAAILVLPGCDEQNQLVAPPPPEVTVARPVMRSVPDYVEFTGTTRATESVDLRARVSGYLKEVHFKDGVDVAKGDPLFTIDQAPYKAALQAAVAEVSKADAALQLKQANLNRSTELFRRNVITQQELDVQKAELSTAKADLDAAKAAETRAELDLGYTVLNSPISGHIGRRLMDVGNLVHAEQEILARIESIDQIYAYFDIAETELIRFMEMIRKHELKDPEKNKIELQLQVANQSGFPHKGVLDFRAIAIDPATGTAQRRGIFENKRHVLLPGMFVRIRARLPTVEDAPEKPTVEERAVSADQQGNYLLIVGADNKVEYRPVRLGILSGKARVVEEGLDADDWVVINGLQRAQPQSTVDPMRVEMFTGKPLKEPVVSPGEAEDAGEQRQTTDQDQQP